MKHSVITARDESYQYYKGIIMTVALLQKLMTSVVILTTFFALYIYALHTDLTRKINKSILQLVPGILMFMVGVFVARVLNNPEYIFKTILPIKSGFAKSILGTTMLPLIAASIRLMSIIACLTALIDKCWYFWRTTRINYFFRLLSTICMTIVAGNTLYKIIFTDKIERIYTTAKFITLSYWVGLGLGSVFVLVAILAVPNLLPGKQES